MFIAFEGVDGSGKSTVAKRVFANLQNFLGDDERVILTREPGGTPLAEAIRGLILNTPEDCEYMLPVTQAMLFSAARHQHAIHHIRPALNARKVVIADRYVASTFAYQYIQGVREDQLEQLRLMACNGVYPDLTIYLEVSEEEAFARRGDRGGDDAMERRVALQHQRMHAAYMRYAAKYHFNGVSQREWIHVSADADIDEVVNDVLAKIFNSHAWERYRNPQTSPAPVSQG